MRYGVTLGNMGPCGDPRVIADLAVEVEDAGWDALFIADCVYIAHNGPTPTCDPWIALAAAAARTQRIRLGTMVTPLARRRPWKVARETVSLDRLSGGRLILPVGLGTLDDRGFGGVGEATGTKERAELLDEALAIIAGLWSGKPFGFEGTHYHVEEMQFLPPPMQQPRIPVWVVGAWPRERSLRRALRWDGLLPNVLNPDGTHGELTPERIRDMAIYVAAHRDPGTPFDIVVEGSTPADDPAHAADVVRPYADAGATWWLDAFWHALDDVDGIRRRIAAGRPRVA